MQTFLGVNQASISKAERGRMDVPDTWVAILKDKGFDTEGYITNKYSVPEKQYLSDNLDHNMIDQKIKEMSEQLKKGELENMAYKEELRELKAEIKIVKELLFRFVDKSNKD